MVAYWLLELVADQLEVLRIFAILDFSMRCDISVGRLNCWLKPR